MGELANECNKYGARTVYRPASWSARRLAPVLEFEWQKRYSMIRDSRTLDATEYVALWHHASYSQYVTIRYDSSNTITATYWYFCGTTV